VESGREGAAGDFAGTRAPTASTSSTARFLGRAAAQGAHADLAAALGELGVWVRLH